MAYRVNCSKPNSPLRQATIDYMTLRNLSHNTQQRAEQLREPVLKQMNLGASQQQ